MIDLDMTELLGYAAAGLVLATFSARSITALRSLAIASNLLFIAYAACAHLLPVLVLHVLLLPINLTRLCQALTAGSADVPDEPQRDGWKKQQHHCAQGIADEEGHHALVALGNRQVLGHAVDDVDVEPHRRRQ